jgi:hypothetical protein
MPFARVYDYDKQQVRDAEWFHTRKAPTCEAAGKAIKTVHGLMSFQCGIPAAFEVDGHKYCWRHKRALDNGGKIPLFPPGPVKK